MKVLGITTEGDGGAAVVEDGRILAAVNEERLCRMKLVVGFPRGAIAEVMRLSGCRAGDFDAAIIAATMSEFVDELEPFDGWFQGMRHGSGGMIKRVAGHLARYRDALPFLETGYYVLQAPAYLHRRRAIRAILRHELDLRCPIVFVDHHFAHITSAYFTSGFRDALVISIDGGGDGRSSRVYAVRDGRFTSLAETSAYNSLGNYYAYVTHICGFKAQKHEGKITGLAAHGQPVYVDLLREFIDEEGGRLINKGRVAFGGAIRALERRLPRGWTREDLAASIQLHFEDVVRRYVSHWCARTGLRDVALAGGVFANVRVNEEVHRLEHVDRVFIHPHMGDGGLCVGAALAACVPGVLPRTMRAPEQPIGDVYLGPAPSGPTIEAALRAHGLSPEPLDVPLEERIAELLAEGHVVARTDGRMEYGPRALGNRSILYQPADPSVNDWLNRNLSRTEFMPFAPSVLYEERERCFDAVAGAEHPAEFMTITFHCTPWMRRHMPGVVHLDGTARPHLVRRDRNPGMYRIIEAFRERTGLPGIINTSFNMHEEPIVCTADDAVRAFLTGKLDYLAIGPFLVKHPAGVSHPLKPVRPAG
ncbi:MAG TPA: carbamoyltransferase C-terminal domain-containing protein [Longimicrobiales bacterium]